MQKLEIKSKEINIDNSGEMLFYDGFVARKYRRTLKSVLLLLPFVFLFLSLGCALMGAILESNMIQFVQIFGYLIFCVIISFIDNLSIYLTAKNCKALEYRSFWLRNILFLLLAPAEIYFIIKSKPPFFATGILEILSFPICVVGFLVLLSHLFSGKNLKSALRKNKSVKFWFILQTIFSFMLVSLIISFLVISFYNSSYKVSLYFELSQYIAALLICVHLVMKAIMCIKLAKISNKIKGTK